MPSTIFMTGGTSGLGRVAARRLLDTGASLLIAGRSPVPEGAQGIVADLCGLDAVRALARDISTWTEGRGLDAVILNAGGYAEGRTPEGYDRAFVLNYLAHYLLLELLWPLLADNGRIILTTSGTHDPVEHSRAPSPRHANALWLARPEHDPGFDSSPRVAGARAYAASKLCVVLHARALTLRKETFSRKIRVIAYDPGPTPGTGLARTLPAPIRLLWERCPGVLRWLMRAKANTVETAGNTLADLALGWSAVPEGVVYAALRKGRLTWPPLSVHAQQDDLMHALERDSALLVQNQVL